VAVVIHSLAELAEFQAASGPDNLVFRGQGDAGWALVPSLYRGMESLDITGWESWINDRERDIFREFSDRSKRFRQDETPWDILVTAQHHGTPTRLLDWTSNAQAALFFACSASLVSDGAIWCADPSKMPIPAYIGRIHNGLGLRKERLASYIPERELPFCQPFSKNMPPPGTPAAPVQPAFDQNGNPGLSGILTFFVPEHINARVAAQISLFSVYISEYYSEEIVVDHSAYFRSVEKNFNTHILDKLTIPALAKEEILSSLHRVGVDATSIYPDLYGLGLYLGSWQRRLVEDIQ
jgi:hypothetical protein